ncbi:hypothetical protein WBG78_02470 [Chryseolinea sp. T2]|uniref:hypothetical protein n=1 Tax=Chryseolinea sp. T2 TaxID=3129255 RepID=UPI003077A05A
MTLELYSRINYVASILTAVALLLCLYKFPQRSPEIKIQGLNFLLSTAVALYIIISGVSGPPINIPQNMYIMPMILLNLLMFDFAWNGRYRKVTVASSVLFCAFAAWNFLYGQGANFNSNTMVFGGVFIMIHCVLFYYYLLADLPVQRLDKLPMFWFNAGYLTCFGGSLFIFAAYVVEVFRDSLLLYWSIGNVLRIAQFILIIVGLWQDLRNIRSHSSLPSAR